MRWPPESPRRRGPAPRAACRAAAAAGLLAGALAGPSAGAAPVSVPDDLGHTLVLAQPAQRVVALAPHLAELVFAAGGGARLRGVMRFSTEPPEAARLPVVGDAFALNIERIAQLQPDLLLLWHSGINPRQQQRLAVLPQPVYRSEITTVDGIASTLRRLGRLMGTEAVAEAAARHTEARWQALQQRYAGRAPVRVFYQLWHAPLMTVGRGHLIDQAITACGGRNVFAAAPGLTPTIGWEAAAAAAPELVVTGASAEEPARLQRWQALAQVPAVRHGLVVALDDHRLARMSPAFIDGAEALCRQIDRARAAQAGR